MLTMKIDGTIQRKMFSQNAPSSLNDLPVNQKTKNANGTASGIEMYEANSKYFCLLSCLSNISYPFQLKSVCSFGRSDQ